MHPQPPTAPRNTPDGAEQAPRSIARRDFLATGVMAAVGLAIGGPLLAACSSSKSTAGAAATTSAAATNSAPAPVASASGGASSSAAAPVGNRTISVWTWYGDQGMPNNSPLGPAFEKANPGVTVDIRTFGSTTDYSPALAAAISAGKTPDIFGPSFSVLTYGQQGVALDLKQALGDQFLSQFFQADNDQFTTDGKQYGIGWNAQSFGMFYDPALLSKANVAPPETWDDLIKAVPALKAAGLIPLTLPSSPSYGLSDFVCPLITQATDDPTLLLKIDAQQDGKNWNDPAVVAALDKLQQLVKGKVFDDGLLAVTYPIAQNLLTSGKTAFLWDGSWVPAGLTSAAPTFKYGLAQTPAWSAGAKHWTGDQAGAALCVNAKSPHQEDALNFLKFIFDPTRYSATLNADSAMPATKAAAATVSDPNIKTMTSWLLDGLGAPHILYGPGSETGLSDACVAIVQGKTTPKDAAASIQAAVNSAKNK
jgi:ABC-type glycerol-3-phosphate transport system substrate-binding protein